MLCIRDMSSMVVSRWLSLLQSALYSRCGTVNFFKFLV